MRTFREDTACSACGCRDVGVRHVPAGARLEARTLLGDRTHTRAEQEYLLRTCTRCGKAWREAPLDRRTDRRPVEERQADAARIAACVNACAGIDDPAAALAEVRRLLEAIATQKYGGHVSALDEPTPRPTCDPRAAARAALALLGPGPS